ncbi:MAG: Spy/CpxP family protein refolding chaperone [Candidatus Binatia bacterium]
MQKIRKFILGSAVLALSTVAMINSPSAADPESARPTRRPFAHGDRMAGGFVGAPLITIALNHKTELNLSNDQVAKLEQIKSQYQSQIAPLVQQLQANEKDIASLMQQTPADLIQIKSKIQEGEKDRSELRYQRIEALDSGRSVLTAQQQDQLKTLVSSRRGQFHKPQGQPS